MILSHLRWGIRVGLLFFLGVVPAIVLFVLLLIMMALAAVIPDMVSFLAVVAILALVGIVGLCAATFRDEQPTVLANAATISCVLVGLFAAVVYFLGIAPDAIKEGGFFLLVATLLLGPIACAVYFLVEQLTLAFRRRYGASSNSLECDAGNPRASG